METIWRWLSGKKTTIAAMAGPALLWLFAKGIIDESDMTFAAAILTAWTGIAIVHKGTKALHKILILTVLCGLSGVVGCSRKGAKFDTAPDYYPTAKKETLLQPVEHAASTPDVCPATKTIVIYFSFDSDNISSEAEAKIAGISTDNEIVLVGGCCPIGEEAYNLELGFRRAMAVEKCLTRRLFVPTAVRSVGEFNLAATMPAEYWKNRRVEITY